MREEPRAQGSAAVSRRDERDISIAEAEQAAQGLPIGVRLRIAIELLRTVAGPAVPVMPRTPGSRLSFERLWVRRTGAISATGSGDASGAALVVWEILAGHALAGGSPCRLHDVVDDMPPDVDDILMDALQRSDAPITVAQLVDDLCFAGARYAVRSEDLWEALASAVGASHPARSSLRDVTRPPKVAAASPSLQAPVHVPAPEHSTPPEPLATGASRAGPEASLLLIHAGAEGGELADALRAKGYAVVVCRDAATGLAYALGHDPMCILCESDLPDDDGDAVVRQLRAHPSDVAGAPFILLASRADTRKRIARFGAGADVCLLKPVSTSILINQVDALVAMASRLRAAHRAVAVTPPVPTSVAFSGDLGQVGLGVVLTIFEMERRTGTLVVTAESDLVPEGQPTVSAIDADARLLELELASGRVAAAGVMGVPAPPLDVVRAMLTMTVGRFVFKPSPARYVDAPGLSELLTEAARIEDEAAAGRV